MKGKAQKPSNSNPYCSFLRYNPAGSNNLNLQCCENVKSVKNIKVQTRQKRKSNKRMSCYRKRTRNWHRHGKGQIDWNRWAVNVLNNLLMLLMIILLVMVMMLRVVTVILILMMVITRKFWYDLTQKYSQRSLKGESQ